jgi:hypothetical protein
MKFHGVAHASPCTQLSYPRSFPFRTQQEFRLLVSQKFAVAVELQVILTGNISIYTLTVNHQSLELGQNGRSNG